MILSSILLSTLFTYHSAILLAHDLYWTDDRILDAVTAADNLSKPSQFDLIRYGDRAFPAFERWLEKPAMDGRDSTGRIIGILRHYKADRNRFLKYAAQALSRELSETRITALLLLTQIGSVKEASAVAALLSDDEVAVAFEAGDCLIAIGAERELIAFDITLRAELAKGKTDRDWLKTKRDKLKERLDTLAAKAKPVPPPPIDETVTPLKRVLAALSDDMDAGKADRAWLAELKDKAYPAYHHILRDPGTKPAVARELFIRLKATAGDRSAFLPLALARLAHDDVDLRIAALNLIQAIGSSRDTSPVVALLGDERQLVSNLALETLATIGGENDLIALDIWLQSAGEKYKPNGLPRYYVEQRAKLQSRVEKERLPSKGLKK